MTEEIISITVWYNDGDMFEDWGDEYDTEASLERYESMITRELQETYPGAEIEIIRNRNVSGWCREPMVNGMSGHAEIHTIEAIMTDVYGTFDWLVEA